MKILVTGGAGFIGSNLVLRLLEFGHDVTVLDNLAAQIHGAEPETSPTYRSIAGRVCFLRGDVTVANDVRRALRGQEAIVHFAAETGTGQSMYCIERYTKVNIGGTALLLDLLANEPHVVKRVIVASSRAVYGEGKYRSKELGPVYPKPRCAEDMRKGDFAVKYPGSSELTLVATDENSKIHPTSVYGITKQVQEELVMMVCPSIGIEAVALRYQNVFGPGQSLSNPYTGILSIFSNLVMNSQPINVFEDGDESRDFIFVDDAVSATALAIESAAAAGEVFNVGTGVPVTVKAVAQALIDKLAGDSTLRISGNFRIGDVRHNYADLTKINSLLGFSPVVEFGDGLSRFCSWVRAIGPVANNYEASLREMRAKGLLN